MSLSPDYNDLELENGLYDNSRDFGDYQEYQPDYFTDVWNYCGLLSIQSIRPLILKLIFLNLSFGVVISSFMLPSNAFHLLSGTIGIYLISEVCNPNGRWIVLFYVLIAYSVLLGSHYCRALYKTGIGTFIKIIFIVSLILSEHLILDKEVFLQVRGILMVLVMKVLSLIDDAAVRKEKVSTVEFLGYILCGSNVLFGPWISFQEYLDLHLHKTEKNIYWILGVIKSLVLSLVCLTISNCWASYLIPDTSNRWFLTYRDALAFRYSHYFVSYMAETNMIAAGFRNPKNGRTMWTYTIVNPIAVELPTSLSVVVTKWNGPMHVFLKKFIYQPMKKHGVFTAVMATFLISSFLHGLEVRVSVILVSLGIFSYLQVKARFYLSSMIDCCMNVKPCKECSHKYKRNHLITRIFLLVYMFTSILHLAYLGVLIDSSYNEVSIYEIWNNLYFIGHVIMLFNFLLTL